MIKELGKRNKEAKLTKTKYINKKNFNMKFYDQNLWVKLPIVSSVLNCFVELASKQDLEELFFLRESGCLYKLSEPDERIALYHFFDIIPLFLNSNLLSDKEAVDIYLRQRDYSAVLVVYFDDLRQNTIDIGYSIKIVENEEDINLLNNFKWKYKGFVNLRISYKENKFFKPNIYLENLLLFVKQDQVSINN